MDGYLPGRERTGLMCAGGGVWAGSGSGGCSHRGDLGVPMKNPQPSWMRRPHHPDNFSGRSRIPTVQPDF